MVPVIKYRPREGAPIIRYVNAYLRGLEKDERIANAYLKQRVPEQLREAVYNEAKNIQRKT